MRKFGIAVLAANLLVAANVVAVKKTVKIRSKMCDEFREPFDTKNYEMRYNH